MTIRLSAFAFRTRILLGAIILLALSALPLFAQPVITSAGATIISESGPANLAIDPDETVTVSFCVQNAGTTNTINLVGTLQATGNVTSPSGPQNYGVVVASGPPVCRNFTFTAGSSNQTAATIQFQDGASDLGDVIYQFGPCPLTCPANITVSNDPNQCGAVVNYPAPTQPGACSGTIAASPASGSFFPVGTTSVTATSTSGGSCNFTITVVDTQPPTITCPADVSAPATSPAGAVVTYPPPTASDNCPGITAICSPASGSTFAPGSTTVNCVATDANGNTATCSFTVTVDASAIPTLSQWMLLLLAASLGLIAVIRLRLS
jgi:HYR domain-containing protein/exosortase sorting signal-containing protein